MSNRVDIDYLFKEFIAYLIYTRGWTWLQLLISSLCDIEVNSHYLNTEDKEIIDTDCVLDYETGTSYAEDVIPKNTLYCEDCPYKDSSKIAEIFYGYQSSGYCHYLGKGDFSFLRPTTILWDGCKECGKYEDISNDFR